MRSRTFRLALVLVLFVLVPLTASPYQIYVANSMLVACIGALGLNLLTGYSGLISVGHAGFLGVGAFTSALLVSKLGWPLWLSVPTAGIVTTLAGVVVGLPALRIKGMYLAIATLAGQVIVEWVLSRPLVAGTGAVAAPRPEALQDDRAYYFVLLGATIAAVVFAHNVLQTRVGRALMAVRDRGVAASAIGIDVGRYKLLAFAVSSCYAGIAGALLGHLNGAVNYEQFQLDLSIQYLAMIIIGGLGSIPGSLLGAVFVMLLPIAVRNVVGAFEPVLSGSRAVLLSGTQTLLFGLVIVAFMAFAPRGLAHSATVVKPWLRRIVGEQTLVHSRRWRSTTDAHLNPTDVVSIPRYGARR